MNAIETTSLLKDEDWFFFSISASKNCKVTLDYLKNVCSLEEVMKYREYVEIMDSMETAVQKDQELKKPSKR